MPYRFTPTRPAFTLIELLVVISIVALLMGILLPALSHARESGRAIVCGSNVRQLVTANLTYAVDNREYLVPASYDALTNLDRWHGRRDTTSEAFDPAKGLLASYLGVGGAVKKCPTFLTFRDDDPGEWTVTFEAGTGGYGYNAQYVGGRNDTQNFPANSTVTARTDDIHRPTQTIFFADAAIYRETAGTTFAIEYSFINGPYWVNADGTFGPFQPNPTMHFRHNSTTANVAWGDGHVTRSEIEFTTPNLVYTPSLTDEDVLAAGFGWIGDPATMDLWDLQ